MSVRNNEERLGASQIDSEAPVAQNLGANPLDFISPTVLVDLPSKGEFYKEGHPLYKAETVEIRMMSTKDEDILTNPSYINKGVVLDRLLSNIIVDKKIRPEDMLLGDKTALLVEARISGFGPYYSVNVTCPSCGETDEEEYDLEECKKTHHGFNPEEHEDIEMLENGNFLVTLPKTKVKAEFRLLNGHDEKVILKSQVKKGAKKSKDQESLVRHYKLMLVDLNGYKDRETINYFSEKMPLSDGRALRDFYSKANPNLNLEAHFECKECGHEEDVEVPLSVEFFWPKF